jgi:Tol biopolymer transport system component
MGMKEINRIVPALVLVAMPVIGQNNSSWSEAANLGPVINSPSTDGCPFIAKSGLSLYFASNRPGGFGGMDIYVSQRDSLEDAWEAPVNLGPEVNGPGNEICPTPTIDGHWFYFVSDRPDGCGGQDLYVAHRRNKRDDLGWNDPQNLGCVVNSAFNDFTPTLFEDDRTGSTVLYFSSNRPGGPGGVDIYTSSTGADGIFGPAALVTELSTPFNDQRPNVRKDGLEIFFDSNRSGSFGSTDLWVAVREDTLAPWSLPAPLESVNTSSLEGRPSLSFDGTILYFMSDRPGGAGDIDLYVASRAKQPNCGKRALP